MSYYDIPIIDFPNTSSGKHAVYPPTVDVKPELCMRDVLIKRLQLDKMHYVEAWNLADHVCATLIGHASSGTIESLPAIREIFDRIDGPANVAQSVATLRMPPGIPPESTFYRHAGCPAPQ